MKNHLIPTLLWCLWLTLTVGAASSANAAHPSDYNAVPLDTLAITVDLPQSTKPKAHTGIVLWRTSDSTLDLVIDIEAIIFSGDCSNLDSVPLHEICSELSSKSVEMSLSGPHSQLALNGNVRVLMQGWGDRIGSGASTYFLDCNGLVLGVHSYSCQLEGGVWSHSLISSDVGECLSCLATCEPTCNYVSID